MDNLDSGTGRYFALMAGLLAIQLLIIILSPSDVGGHLNPLFRESGPIEELSPICYALCMVLIVALGGAKFAFTRAPSLMVVLLAMMLRELDFHTRFTVMSITKTRFFLSGDVPLQQKVLAFLALALIGLAVLHVIFAHGRAFVARLRRFDPVGVAAALSIAMILLSEGLDGAYNTLAKIGLPISIAQGEFLEKVEETAEMGIPIFAALAILAYFGTRRERKNGEA
ncbi:MAG: hypothetical protein WBG88_16940 [Mesorhizobium sp.]